MSVRFPHANGFEITDYEFMAAWQLVGKAFGPDGWDWRSDAMPRCHRRECFADLLQKSLHFGVDAMCRCLVPSSYHNTMHATNEFMDANAHLLRREQACNPASDRYVAGAALTRSALDEWDHLTPERREGLLIGAKGALDPLLRADAGRTKIVRRPPPPRRPARRKTAPRREPRSAMEVRNFPIPDRSTALTSDGLKSGDLHCFAQALIEWIACALHRPYYRREPLGHECVGWPARLLAYFWPDPATDYVETATQLRPLFEEGAFLAGRLEEARRWSREEANRAVALAENVFAWGGVPQREVTPSIVGEVFWNALRDRLAFPSARMNSGWTKIAAFATAHLEGEPKRHPQVIWDSRVSTAIVWRLDQLLTACGASRVPDCLGDLGYVTGRGGTRPRALNQNWRSGYGDWRCQFAGSDFVVAMRDVLNEAGGERDYPPMPLPNGRTGAWTVRGVEMVLFGDGY